ncbi:hypothetical protein LBMAG52_01070 [Planctomycetia bacterium]|nr:hypothetical protein LBMAG52_01070 [Planctomycetia bacterium]
MCGWLWRVFENGISEFGVSRRGRGKSRAGAQRPTSLANPSKKIGVFGGGGGSDIWNGASIEVIARVRPLVQKLGRIEKSESA